MYKKRMVVLPVHCHPYTKFLWFLAVPSLHSLTFWEMFSILVCTLKFCKSTRHRQVHFSHQSNMIMYAYKIQTYNCTGNAIHENHALKSWVMPLTCSCYEYSVYMNSLCTTDHLAIMPEQHSEGSVAKLRLPIENSGIHTYSRNFLPASSTNILQYK